MSDVYVCIYINKQARKTRGCSPRKCLEIRCFEIAFGQKQWRSSYYFSKFLAVLHAFARPADLKNPREEGTKVDRTVSGVTSIEGQLVNSRALDIAIYLRTYLREQFTRVRSTLVLYPHSCNQTCLDNSDSQ